MGRMTIVVPDDDLEKKFRVEVTRRYGSEKGSLGKAVAEAMKLWLEKGKKK